MDARRGDFDEGELTAVGAVEPVEVVGGEGGEAVAAVGGGGGAVEADMDGVVAPAPGEVCLAANGDVVCAGILEVHVI